jgi:hypothetical protein
MFNRNDYKILPLIFLLVSCSVNKKITPGRISVESENNGSFSQELSSPDVDYNAYTPEERQRIESLEIDSVEPPVKSENEFSTEKPGSELCAFATSLYNDLGSFASDRLWQQKTDALEVLLLLYFKTEESLLIDNKKELPFVTSLASPDKKIMLYSWNQKVLAYPESFNGIIQYVTSTGEPGAVTAEWMNMYDHEFTNIYLLKDNVYLLYGENPARDAALAEFVTLEFDESEDRLTSYNAFNYKTKLLVQVDGLRGEYRFGGTHVIDYSYNFDKEPYTITITYIQFINEDIKTTYGYIIVAGNSVTKKAEFVFNGEEFIGGDYSIFER